MGAVLCRGTLQSGAESGVERFQVCKAVAEGNVGQAVGGQGQVDEGVLEPHPGQVLVEIDAYDLLEEGGKVGAVVLSVIASLSGM